MRGGATHIVLRVTCARPVRAPRAQRIPISPARPAPRPRPSRARPPYYTFFLLAPPPHFRAAGGDIPAHTPGGYPRTPRRRYIKLVYPRTAPGISGPDAA